MVYGGFVLFGYHADVSLFTMTSPLLILLLFIFVVALPVIGNLFPQWISFLLSMPMWL